MKTKSKLVLGLSILSAATLAAGATSTFAWFTATNTASTTSKNANLTSVNVSGTKNLGEIDLSDAISISIKCLANSTQSNDPVTDTAATTSSAMEMVSYLKVNTETGLADNSGTAGWYFGYVGADSQNHYQTTQIAGSNDYWRYYEVIITISETLVVGNVTYNVPTELSGKTYELALSLGTNSNAFVYGLSTTIAADKAAAAPETAGHTIASSDKWSGQSFTSGAHKYYFGMYVDGDSHTTDDDTVTGDINVVMSAAA
ncbi:MAG: hypothetical protein IJU64_07135 [Bacilli bacterium]|nr:hypothetical protein [Bacilli bacterium]